MHMEKHLDTDSGYGKIYGYGQWIWISIWKRIVDMDKHMVMGSGYEKKLLIQITTMAMDKLQL